MKRMRVVSYVPETHVAALWDCKGDGPLTMVDAETAIGWTGWGGRLGPRVVGGSGWGDQREVGGYVSAVEHEQPERVRQPRGVSGRGRAWGGDAAGGCR